MSYPTEFLCLCHSSPVLLVSPRQDNPEESAWHTLTRFRNPARTTTTPWSVCKDRAKYHEVSSWASALLSIAWEVLRLLTITGSLLTSEVCLRAHSLFLWLSRLGLRRAMVLGYGWSLGRGSGKRGQGWGMCPVYYFYGLLISNPVPSYCFLPAALRSGLFLVA